MDYSLLAGGLTLALIILPTIIRATEESILAVPDSLREAGLALGAGKARTVFKVVLPAAMSGIVTSIILSIGRIVGESAALIYTAGAVPYTPSGYLDQGSSFAVMMWMFAGEGMVCGQRLRNRVYTYDFRGALESAGDALRKKIQKKTGNCKMSIRYLFGKKKAYTDAATKTKEKTTGSKARSISDFAFDGDVAVKTENLDLFYGEMQALKHIDMTVPTRKVTALIGPSGCGKSTLLRTFNRMNDLVEGCKVSGSVKNRRHGRLSNKRKSHRAAQKRGHGISKAQSLSHEYLRQRGFRPPQLRYKKQGGAGLHSGNVAQTGCYVGRIEGQTGQKRARHFGRAAAAAVHCAGACGQPRRFC